MKFSKAMYILMISIEMKPYRTEKDSWVKLSERTSIYFEFCLSTRSCWTCESLRKLKEKSRNSWRNASMQLVDRISTKTDEREPDRMYVTWLSAKQ